MQKSPHSLVSVELCGTHLKISCSNLKHLCEYLLKDHCPTKSLFFVSTLRWICLFISSFFIFNEGQQLKNNKVYLEKNSHFCEPLHYYAYCTIFNSSTLNNFYKEISFALSNDIFYEIIEWSSLFHKNKITIFCGGDSLQFFPLKLSQCAFERDW